VAALDQYVTVNWRRHFHRLDESPRAALRSTGACPLPVSLALPDAFHRTPALVRAEVLQRRAPLAHEASVAAGPVTTGVEKTS